MELMPRWLTSTWQWIRSDPKAAALVAYISLSTLGFVGSTIFYAQLGIWYPNLAGVADYFLATLQNFLALIFIPFMIAASVVYYWLGLTVEASMRKFDAIVERMEAKKENNNWLWKKTLVFHKKIVGPIIHAMVAAYKGSFVVLMPLSIVVTFVLLPLTNGKEIAKGSDANLINPASTDVTINGEVATFLGSTSSFLLFLKRDERKILVLPRTEIDSMTVSIE